MKHFYRFFRDYGRMGYLSSAFVATEEEISGIIGKKVYFGDVLGKHSNVVATMREEDFTLVNTSEQFIQEWEKIEYLGGRMNPFDYLEEEETDVE